MYSHASTKDQSVSAEAFCTTESRATPMTDLLRCPILSSLCAAMPNSLSFSPTTTHHKAPFHTQAHTSSSSCPLRCELMRATEAVTSVVYCLVGLVVVLQLFQQGLCNPCSLAARQAAILHRLKCACVCVRLFVCLFVCCNLQTIVLNLQHACPCAANSRGPRISCRVFISCAQWVQGWCVEELQHSFPPSPHVSQNPPLQQQTGKQLWLACDEELRAAEGSARALGAPCGCREYTTTMMGFISTGTAGLTVALCW